MNAVTPLPCPSCGGQLQDGVFTEICPFCGQALDISQCPACGEPLTKVRQPRQRVAFCDTCSYLQVQQGLTQAGNQPVPQTVTPTPIIISGSQGMVGKICQRCGMQNRSDANFCKQCGSRF